MQDVSDQTYLSRFIMISDSCVNQLLLCWFKNGVFLIFHFFTKSEVCCPSVAQSYLTLWPHGLQHAGLPCPSPSPGAYSDSCPLSGSWHPIIPSSVVLFLSHLQSFPASRSFSMSQFFASGGQNIGVSASASVLPMNNQDWFPLGWTGWISLQFKGLSRVFSNTTVQKHQFLGWCSVFFMVQLLTSVHDY